jgi:hypothetical protein
MEKFFEAAINLVKSDAGIVAIVLIVAVMMAIVLMSKRKKVKDAFSNNVNTKVNVNAKQSTDGVTIENSGNGNRDSKIDIQL